jgi:hypothetical protein
MGAWAKLTGRAEPTAGRTPKERRRRAKEIKAIDARTSAWLRAGGRAAKTPKGWS